MIALTGLWNEKYSDLMANYFPYLYDVACQARWRNLSSEARGPKARPSVTMECTWLIKK